MVSIDQFVAFPIVREQEVVFIGEFGMGGREGHDVLPFRGLRSNNHMVSVNVARAVLKVKAGSSRRSKLLDRHESITQLCLLCQVTPPPLFWPRVEKLPKRGVDHKRPNT